MNFALNAGTWFKEEACSVLRHESYTSVLKKQQQQDIFFSLEHRLLVAKDPLFSTFKGWKIRSFLSQKDGGNMIFINY